ncbi:MAG TPA: glycosyltransferase family 1 protein [Patescibacteria group bacterium]|nr:glycosyltransferase family 1 protein [Patescibacteria group bacterium]
MRIGIDCRFIQETGVGRYTRNLIEQLAKIDKKNNYVVFLNAKAKDLVLQLTNHNENWQIVETDIPWHGIEEQMLFPEVINRQNLDLMHFPYFSVPFMYSKPFVVTVHDLILHHFPTGEASTLPGFAYWIKLQGYKFVMRKAVEKAKKILTVSQATKQEIVNTLHVSDKKIVVTYEGVEHKFQMTNDKLPIKAKKRKYFLHVGNVYPHKNCNRLVEAVQLLLEKNPDVDLIFIGKMDYFMNKLQGKVKQLNLEKNILFLGEINDTELSVYYENAVALVMPSLMEGFGLPAVEAMAQKCLVIASDTPALKEVCKDAVIYCQQLNIEDIAKTMEKALQLTTVQKKEYIENGRKIIAGLSWQTMARQTLTVYESCISI